jgi:MOSC domain-containing protein YiiM
MPRVVIHGIYTSPGHNFFGHHEREPSEHAIVAHESVELVAGKGIPGDRFFGWKDGYKGQVTFIDRQTVDVVREHAGDPGIEPSAFRRNVVISGVDLNALVGKTFRLGDALLEGTQKCAPCYWMDTACGRAGTEKVMFNRGGLRCRILESGLIRLGDMEIGEAEPSVVGG